MSMAWGNGVMVVAIVGRCFMVETAPPQQAISDPDGLRLQPRVGQVTFVTVKLSSNYQG